MTEHQLPPVTGNGEHATVKLSDYLLAVRAGDLAFNQERDRRDAELTTLPTAKAGGFLPSRAGVPVSQPTADGRTRAV